MNILLIDLNHKTVGIHNNTVPLGSVLIKAYLLKHIPTGLDIRISKDYDDAIAKTATWRPDIIGCANYTWNTELNYHFVRTIRERYPGILVVVGGPDLELTSSARLAYFHQYPLIDICVAFDGEIPFLEIVKLKLSGYTDDFIRDNPVAGTYGYNYEWGVLHESHEPPPRLTSLDDFGSIYADHLLDEFLDKGYNPFVQTHRGCPYQCTFCHTSNSYYSKMLFQSPNIFRYDIEYLAKRYAGRKDVTLYIANTNMAAFEQDFEIATIIKEMQDTYGWPTMFNVNSGKDPKKLLRMLDIINIQPGLALQTLTPHVIQNIRRINFPFNQYVAFQKEVVKKTGIASVTELILSLPGETKETFLDTLRSVLNSGVQNIVIYTLMNLRGTPLSSKAAQQQYGHTIRYRIVPRQFSRIGKDTIFDIEEVVVATSTMPFEDYLSLRRLALIVGTFYSTELIPLKRFLLEEGLDLAQWINTINTTLENFPGLQRVVDEFATETEEELFPSKEALHTHYRKPENFALLVSGERGDNLVRKYKCQILSQHYTEFLNSAFDSALSLTTSPEIQSALSALQSYVRLRDLSPALLHTQHIPNQQLTLDYDVHLWLASEKNAESLLAFHRPVSYLVTYDPNLLQRIHTYLTTMNKNPLLSLQILYRDGGIRELWPTVTMGGTHA